MQQLTCNYHQLEAGSSDNNNHHESGDEDSDDDGDDGDDEERKEKKEHHQVVMNAMAEMLVLFECIETTSTFEYFKLPHTYDQLLSASLDNTTEGQMVGLIGGLWKDVVAGRRCQRNRLRDVRLISRLMLDENKRRPFCFQLLIPGLWDKVKNIILTCRLLFILFIDFFSLFFFWNFPTTRSCTSCSSRVKLAICWSF